MEVITSIDELDEATLSEIRAAQEDGVSSKAVSSQMEIPLEIVNKVYSTLAKSEGVAVSVLDNTKSGFYKHLVASKVEENSNLKEQRAWLMEQVYFLRKSISFLNQRKDELERGIKQMEKNILAGLPAIEQLEDNGKFSKISDKVRKKNT